METAADDDGSAPDDEFDIYEELQLDTLKPAPPVASALAAAAIFSHATASA